MSEEDLEYFQKDTGQKDRNGNSIMLTYVRASKSFRREYLAKLREIGIATETKPMLGQPDLNQIEYVYPAREYKPQRESTARATAVTRDGKTLDENFDWTSETNFIESLKAMERQKENWEPKSGDEL